MQPLLRHPNFPTKTALRHQFTSVLHFSKGTPERPRPRCHPLGRGEAFLVCEVRILWNRQTFQVVYLVLSSSLAFDPFVRLQYGRPDSERRGDQIRRQRGVR
jgi:hypothetical protein